MGSHHEEGVKSRRRRLHVVAALIRKGSRILLDRRHQGQLAGTWEFPGGKREVGESDAQALRREVCEELGVDATIGPEVARTEHVYERVAITLVLYETHLHGEPHAVDVDMIDWFDLDALDELPMPPADRPLIEAVRRLLRRRRIAGLKREG